MRSRNYRTRLLWRAALVVSITGIVALLPNAALTAHPQSADQQRSQPLPDSLSDAEFWSLVTTFSEPGGSFQSDNFTSNEINFPTIAASLADSGPHGGAYIGVGPEQNFHYIAAIRPKIAFQLDIRRQAIVQHLMYKAIFELSADRAGFISLLFSMPRPAGIDTIQSIDKIWYAHRLTRGDSALFTANFPRIRDHLIRTHGFALTADDTASLGLVYRAFFRTGPSISYSGMSTTVNFLLLTAALDQTLTPRSFLASEETYAFIKRMHERNLIVPVVGDFAGPHAVRSVANYLQTHGTRVSAFYVSNVESYLFRNGVWRDFYANVATLPLDSTSVFIRPYGPIGRAGRAMIVIDGVARGGNAVSIAAGSGSLTLEALCPIQAFLRAYNAGRVLAYADARRCVR
jgi:hypothetical protein